MPGEIDSGGVIDPIIPEEPQSAPMKTVIGIIYPPPEVRNIVDKTASFVARIGVEFENRIRSHEAGNPKFNFLNVGDPYHAYYQHKIKEAREGKPQEEAAITPPGTGPVAAQGKPAPSVSKLQSDFLKLHVDAPFVPKDPPAEWEFVCDPPSISAMDLDLVKLTAQFVARNGRTFLTGLMNREQRNFQFDFLRPQHSLFQYFTKLLEQYTKVLIPPKDLKERLNRDGVESKQVLKDSAYRAEWIKYEERQRRRIEEEEERERVAYAQIDWHDFVVVETVDYQPWEQGSFPPPTNPEEVGSRSLLHERIEAEGAFEDDEDNDVEMQIESDEEDEPSKKSKKQAANKASKQDKRPPPPPPKERPAPPPLPPTPDQVLIKKDYDPKAASKKPTAAPSGDQFLISPLTGERIPASSVAEHMRIGLLDPRWVEERDRMQQEKAQEEHVYAPGIAIESTLKKFAERRTDIFGVGDEETQIGKKIGEESEQRRDDRVIWDGHSASMESATRAARANITFEEQLQEIHKAKGLVVDTEKEKIGPKVTQVSMQHQTIPRPQPPPPQPPPVMMGLPPTMVMLPTPTMVIPPPVLVPQPVGMMLGGVRAPQMPQAPMQQQQMQQDYDEPPNKRMKTEETLIPEAQFMARFRGPVRFVVHLPNMPDKTEWRLDGRMVPMTLPLTDTVAVIKAKVHDETGMPPGKQKLHQDGLFFKDSNTLAFYNIGPSSVVVLQLKERGGRKK
ncbi:unnamed protein product [Notodromas monacha]|uniref:Splicing factor 3A subunit 1 n=1 Tax=Notodromas monacha TaxID=399045 RepID=A0A7R9BUY8_9CRUS|nr:unnamed protein product [Notodromas monacha]CAG0922209.1 unnamed protein product [Notodromas monacha]